MWLDLDVLFNNNFIRIVRKLLAFETLLEMSFTSCYLYKVDFTPRHKHFLVNNEEDIEL